jgi:NAD(P)-dependent dehydrogenase (short-subunit alcohol dehydrogenase family)
MNRMNGKVAIITGAASGLGEATAKLFAQEGAKVVIADVQDDLGAKVLAAIKENGGEAAYVYTDVTKPADVQRVVRTAKERYGKLTTMVANAGILGSGSKKTLEDITEEEWGQIINVNLSGVMRCFKYAIPAIRRAGGGVMTTTASTAGVARVGEHLAAYTASKHALIGLVKYTAFETAKDNIRVNCVCPGGMETRIFESVGLSAQERAERNARISSRATANPTVPRTSRTMEVANGHLFLCSDEGAYVNGHALVIDGGSLIQ